MKFNIKTFNISLWITLILAYVLPAQSIDTHTSIYGYPLAFLTVPNLIEGKTLLSSLGVNLLYLLLNIVVVYFIIIFFKSILKKVLPNNR